MGECAFAVAIAHRPNPFDIGTKLIVGCDVTFLVPLDASLIEAEIVGVGAAADRQQNVGGRDAGEPSVQSTPTLISFPCFFRLTHLAFRRRFMPSFRRMSWIARRYVFIFFSNEPRRHFNDRHLAAEPAEHLPKFKSDIAATDDRQVARQEIDGHHRGIGGVWEFDRVRESRESAPGRRH